MAELGALSVVVESWTGITMEAPRVASVGPGRVAAWTLAAPEPGRVNQDTLALVDISDSQGVILVADGAGGLPAGDRAAALAVEAMVETVLAALEAGESTREGILAGFDRANERVLAMGVGAATTLLVAELAEGHLRCYHAGDSQALLCGQRGKLKLHTTSHSPVGYMVAAGVLDSEEAIHHEDLHFVSNLVGNAEMHIELGPPLTLARYDTLVLGSDGLFDNLRAAEIVELLRVGPLEAATRRAVAAARGRMSAAETAEPSKPDDLTLVAFRLGRSEAAPRRRARPRRARSPVVPSLGAPPP